MAEQQGQNQTNNPRSAFRYPVAFEEFYAAGLYQMGPVRPDTVYTGDPNRPGPQQRDPVTGLWVWKASVTDPGEPNSRRRSYDILLLSETEPVPTTDELSAGLRPIVLEGLTVQPRVGGQGEFKYLTYTVRAAGYAPAPAPAVSGRGGAGSGRNQS
ncbi:hypothetical protein NRB56_01490 [Nocardia sp. RB56]|uniref:Uncharacterized protein n=2 Tax=Nocardia aurantia TaxID=2585199 RepID=A0A7K0DGF2_9NOCA|nr:hypothetical protein [Nocardia aurantia]